MFTNFLFWARNAKAAALKAAQRKRVKRVAMREGGDAFKPPRLHVFSREWRRMKTFPHAPAWVLRPEHEVAVVKREQVIDLRV